MVLTTLNITNNGEKTINWKGSGFEVQIPAGSTVSASIPASDATENVAALKKANPEVDVVVVGSVEGGQATHDAEPAYIPLLLYASDYQGVWDASSGDAPSESPTKGEYWKVSTEGTTELSGEDDWAVGNYIQWTGTKWMKIINYASGLLDIDGGELA